MHDVAHELSSFGFAVLVWGAVGLAALVGHRLARVLRVPAPVVFLIVAAILASEVKGIRDAINLNTLINVVTLALIVILFDGGLHLGRRRFQEAAVPILLLGVFGTFITTALIAVLAHVIFGIAWKLSLVLGAALAPTDPAVVFSVLANKQIAGRTSAILEGESGFNDPAGIALLLGFVGLATHAHGSPVSVATTFVLAMGVGTAIGIVGGFTLRWLLSHRRPLMSHQQPLRALAGVLVIYGLATVAQGSGFVAVLIAGMVMGDVEERYEPSVRKFHATLANLGEMVAFVLLGLSFRLHSLTVGWAWLIGVVLALLIAFALRPIACLPLLARADLRPREKAFVAWAGLKGAVPILLGALALRGGVPEANKLYAIVFVVVLISVAAQGGTLAYVARRLGVVTQEATD